jgi:hypothetical protein
MSKAQSEAKKAEIGAQHLINRSMILLRLLKELWEAMERCKAQSKNKSECNKILKFILDDVVMVKRIMAVETNLLSTAYELEKDVELFEKGLLHKIRMVVEARRVHALLKKIQNDAQKETEYLIQLQKALQHLHNYINAKNLFPINSSEHAEWARHSLHYSKQLVEMAEILKEEANLVGKIKQEVMKDFNKAKTRVQKLLQTSRQRFRPVKGGNTPHLKAANSSGYSRAA